MRHRHCRAKASLYKHPDARGRVSAMAPSRERGRRGAKRAPPRRCRAPAALPLLLTLGLGPTGCGPKPVPQRFVESAAFHGRQGRVHGLLQRDVDGDGREDAIIAERGEYGYTVSVLKQVASQDKVEWRPWCTSSLVEGEDIDALRWLEFARKSVIFILVLTENPEEVIQRFAIIDVSAGCRTLFEDEVRLERGDPDRLLAPESLKAGALVSPDASRLVVRDEPQYLTLAGATGQLRVLTSLRERTLSWPAGELVAAERQRSVLRAIPLLARHQDGDGAFHDLPDLSDGRDETVYVAKPGSGARLKLAASRPFVLLELHHGCAGAPARPLTLAAEGGEPFAVGGAPLGGSFILASGAGHEAGGVQRDLVALRVAARELTLDIGPADRERCLREVKAYGFELPDARTAGVR
jgi:hypothetical protein